MEGTPEERRKWRRLEKEWLNGEVSDDAFKKKAAYIGTHYWAMAVTSIGRKDEQA